MDIVSIITAAGVPSALTGLAFWLLERKISQSEAERKEREKKQENLQLIILDSLNGAIALSEATATAVQRIPDARCNGDMRAALDSVKETKRRQQAMITAAGIHNIMHE